MRFFAFYQPRRTGFAKDSRAGLEAVVAAPIGQHRPIFLVLRVWGYRLRSTTATNGISHSCGTTCTCSYRDLNLNMRSLSWEETGGCRQACRQPCCVCLCSFDLRWTSEIALTLTLTLSPVEAYERDCGAQMHAIMITNASLTSLMFRP